MRKIAAVLLAFSLSACAIGEVALESPGGAGSSPPLPSQPAVPEPSVTFPRPIEPTPEEREIPPVTPETARPSPDRAVAKKPPPRRSRYYPPQPLPTSRPLPDPAAVTPVDAVRRDIRRQELEREADSMRSQYGRGNLSPLDYNFMLQKQSEADRLGRPP